MGIDVWGWSRPGIQKRSGTVRVLTAVDQAWESDEEASVHRRMSRPQANSWGMNFRSGFGNDTPKPTQSWLPGSREQRRDKIPADHPEEHRGKQRLAHTDLGDQDSVVM